MVAMNDNWREIENAFRVMIFWRFYHEQQVVEAMQMASMPFPEDMVEEAKIWYETLDEPSKKETQSFGEKLSRLASDIMADRTITTE